MASHFSTLAWKIPWMEEPGRLQSMGSLRVGYDWVTSLSLFTFMHWRRKWQPTPVFLPWESQGWGSLVGCRLRVAQGWTRLKWLSSSMYMSMYEPIHIYFQAISLIQNWITRCTIQTSIYWKVFSLSTVCQDDLSLVLKYCCYPFVAYIHILIQSLWGKIPLRWSWVTSVSWYSHSCAIPTFPATCVFLIMSTNYCF